MLYCDTLIFLKRLQMAATNGQYYYTCGETDLDRYERMAKKFATAYETGLSRQTKHKRRRAGWASASLFAVRRSTIPDQSGKIPVYWVLVASGGIGRVHEREQLRDLRNRDTRLTAGGGQYELVHDGKTWSWKMTTRTYQAYLEKMHRVAALPVERRREIEIDGIRRDRDAEQILDQLYSQPGFRLIRSQVGFLVEAFKGEWKRLRSDKGPKLSERNFLPYVRFMPNKREKAPAAASPTISMEERRALFQAAFPGLLNTAE